MIPFERKFYKSITQHRKCIDRARVILEPPFTTLSFIYHKASGVVEAIQSTPLRIAADYRFQYDVKTFYDIPPYMYDIISNYKHTFGRSQLIWDEEKQLLDVIALNITVRDYDNYLPDINVYDKDIVNEFIIDFNVTNLKGELIDLSSFDEISLKNMGDKTKINKMLINDSGERVVQLEHHNTQSFKITINDFNEENIVRIKVKNTKLQKLWLTDYVALITRR